MRALRLVAAPLPSFAGRGRQPAATAPAAREARPTGAGSWALRLAAALLLTCAGGCGCQPAATAPPPRAAEGAPAARPEGELTEIRLPVVFRFRCLDARLDPELRDNREALEELGELLRGDARLVGVRLIGHQSVTGPERQRPDALSLERARAVRDALAPAFVPPERVEVVGRGWGASHATAEGDACPPPEEDVGHPGRRVEVVVLRSTEVP